MTILGQIFGGWQYGSSAPVLYYYAQDNFTAADGELVVKGNRENRESWYRSVTCTVSGTELTVPQHDLPATYDSDNPNVRWIPILLLSNREIPFFVNAFRLPTTGSGEITWEEIRAFDRTSTPIGDKDFYTAAQQLQLFVRRSESTASINSTDDLAEGSTNLYFTAARVLATVLAGLSTASNTVVTSAHTILQAIGFLQKQVSDNKTTADTHIANVSNPHSVTKTQVGLSAVPNLDTSTTANITDSTNKRFITDAQQTVLGNTSGTNSGNETVNSVGTLINGSTVVTTPADTDRFPLSISSVLRYVTWLNIKATLKTYFDTLYQSALGYTAENTANKDVSGGYVGLTLLKINFKNVANTFTSFFTNSNTAARTYTFPDRTGTIADDTDITNAKARANHTGTQLASTISDFNSAALSAAPAETATSMGTLINNATSKTTPVDADYLPLMDSAASNIMKKLSWANLKATAKTYFDTLYVIAANLGSGVATFLATPSSANLASALTDEIGTGKVLFSDPVINSQTGTSYTLQASDNGKIVECNNASAITVTVPTSLGSGFNCVVVQLGAGQVTLSPSSTTLRNRNGLKTAGQYAAVSILPTSTANTFIVSGDTTT
jgi:hypothetical protein